MFSPDVNMNSGSQEAWTSILQAKGPETVHLVVPAPGLLDDVKSAAEAMGGRCFVISLSGASETADVAQLLGRELRFPYEARGLDVLLDLLSDLDWLENRGPFVLIFQDADQMLATSRTVFESFVEILPNLSDRWQSSDIPFHVVFVVSHQATGEAIERIVYAEIQSSRASPWYRDTHEVRVRRVTPR